METEFTQSEHIPNALTAETIAAARRGEELEDPITDINAWIESI